MFIKLNSVVIALLLITGWICEGVAPTVVAGLPPVANLTKKIAGDKVNVTSALPVGRSPHDYSPKPAVIGKIASAKLYLYTGLPYELHIKDALQGAPVKSVDITKNIKRIPMEEMEEEHEHEHEHHHHHHHEEGELDPHIWLSVENCEILATNIHNELVNMFPQNKAFFDKNYANVIAELKVLKENILKNLTPYKGRTFFVHHAAFGYFAHETGIKQQSIELGGREISPARLASIIKNAKKLDTKVIFVQPQFNPAASRALAQAIGGEAVALDPLAEDVFANFRTLTASIAKGFQAK